VGFKVHLTESCDAELPHRITHVETSPAPAPDTAATLVVQQALQTKQLLPQTHLVDMGYIETELLVESRRADGVERLGPLRGDYRRQAHEGQGCAVEHFPIDWTRQEVVCPQGKRSSSWTPGLDRGGR
jgi:hypothetical protein